MKPRWRKVLHDLWDNKGRTLLVVLSIAVGVFSIGVISGTYQIIANDMSISYAANNRANVELRMENFDENVLASIQNEHDLEDVEARRVFNMRVRAPGTDRWTTLDMVAFEDFEQVNGLLLESGRGQLLGVSQRLPGINEFPAHQEIFSRRAVTNTLQGIGPEQLKLLEKSNQPDTIIFTSEELGLAPQLKEPEILEKRTACPAGRYQGLIHKKLRNCIPGFSGREVRLLRPVP